VAFPLSNHLSFCITPKHCRKTETCEAAWPKYYSDECEMASPLLSGITLWCDIQTSCFSCCTYFF